MKAACDYCDRTAQGTRYELMCFGWSWATIQKPFHRRFTACWHHGDRLAADVDMALATHRKTMERRQRWKS